MTTYNYTVELISVGPGGIVRAAPFQTVTATDPATGLTPANLKQGGVAVSQLVADSKGLLSFQADAAPIDLTSTALGYSRRVEPKETVGTGAGGAGIPVGLMPLSGTPTWRLPLPQANAAASFATGTLYLYPVPILRACTLDGLGLLVTTAGGASSSAYAVAYTDSGAFAPLTRVALTSALDISTTGAKGATFAGVALAVGTLWIGMLVAAGTGQALETLPSVSGGNGPSSVWPWSVMPHGTGATPATNTGNDGSVALQTGLTGSTPPATFAGALQGDSNTPKIRPATWLRLAA